VLGALDVFPSFFSASAKDSSKNNQKRVLSSAPDALNFLRNCGVRYLKLRNNPEVWAKMTVDQVRKENWFLNFFLYQQCLYIDHKVAETKANKVRAPGPTPSSFHAIGFSSILCSIQSLVIKGLVSKRNALAMCEKEGYCALVITANYKSKSSNDGVVETTPGSPGSAPDSPTSADGNGRRSPNKKAPVVGGSPGKKSPRKRKADKDGGVEVRRVREIGIFVPLSSVSVGNNAGAGWGNKFISWLEKDSGLVLPETKQVDTTSSSSSLPFVWYETKSNKMSRKTVFPNFVAYFNEAL
jgi:hypothetical protein